MGFFPVFSLVHLGRMDYLRALAVQERLSAMRKAGALGDVLLLVEHPPVLTLGRNSSRRNVLASDARLAARGIELVEANRGGDVTYHGPGQLVAYPILDLRGFAPRLGAVHYVRLLEETIIRCCADYGVMTQRIPGRTGVWTLPGGSITEKKIAAIGVHISRGVTTHGLALNVTTDLDDFALIVPCGIADRGVTSLEREVDERAHPVPSMEQVANCLARQFGRVFGRQVVWLESLQELAAEMPEGAATAAQQRLAPGLNGEIEQSGRPIARQRLEAIGDFGIE